MLSLFFVLVEVECESFGEGFFQYLSFLVVSSVERCSIPFTTKFFQFFLLGFFCFNSHEYLLSLESLLGSCLLRMTEALEQANLDMEVCSLVDLYLRTVVLLPCNTQSHMSCSRPLMQLQQPLTSPREMWRMELLIAFLAKVLGGHQLFLLLHCRTLRVLEVMIHPFSITRPGAFKNAPSTTLQEWPNCGSIACPSWSSGWTCFCGSPCSCARYSSRMYFGGTPSPRG